MKELEPEASRRLARYLDQVRATLRGARSVDAGDVEADVAAHIRSELAARAGPVSVSVLDEILERLGSPLRWVPTEELSPWRRVVAHLRAGPEDWRLAYLSIAGFLLAIVLAPLGFGPASAVLFLASYLCARATLTLADEDGEELGARSWLVHPALIAIGGVLAAALLVWPLAATVGLADAIVEVEGVRPVFPALVVKHAIGLERILAADQPLDVLISALRSAHVLLFVLGVWWIVLALAARRRPAIARTSFRPLLDRFDGAHARFLAWTGAALVGLAMVAYLANG